MRSKNVYIQFQTTTKNAHLKISAWKMENFSTATTCSGCFIILSFYIINSLMFYIYIYKTPTRKFFCCSTLNFILVRWTRCVLSFFNSYLGKRMNHKKMDVSLRSFFNTFISILFSLFVFVLISRKKIKSNSKSFSWDIHKWKSAT